MSRAPWWTCTAALGLAWALASVPASPEDPRGPFGLGRPATERETAAWDIDVAPSGAGLPAGRGTVAEGARVYAARCASCHGATGSEGPYDRLVGGRGTLGTDEPVKTVGSYWPYATTLFDYVRRAMPYTAPQSLADDEVYAVVAWLLYQNGIVGPDMVLDARTLPQIGMPNRGGFTGDPRPDVETHARENDDATDAPRRGPERN